MAKSDLDMASFEAGRSYEREQRNGGSQRATASSGIEGGAPPRNHGSQRSTASSSQARRGRGKGQQTGGEATA